MPKRFLALTALLLGTSVVCLYVLIGVIVGGGQMLFYEVIWFAIFEVIVFSAIAIFAIYCYIKQLKNYPKIEESTKDTY